MKNAQEIKERIERLEIDRLHFKRRAIMSEDHDAKIAFSGLEIECALRISDLKWVIGMK